MSLTPRDKRILSYLAVVWAIAAAYFFWPAKWVPAAAASADTVAMAEQRLQRIRNIAASAPAKQDVLRKAAAELATRETGLLRSASAQEAQAQVITILRGVLNQEGVQMQGAELGALQPLGDAYALAPVSIAMECRVEQLVNIIAGLGSQKELITTRDIQITASDLQKKTVRVRLTVAGVTLKSLLPEKNKK